MKNNETFIFTISVNCGKITAVMLNSFQKQHPGRKIHVIGCQEDFQEIKNNSIFFDKDVEGATIFFDISHEGEAMEKFKRGHAGTAHVFAMVLAGRCLGVHKYICHIDSDIYFKQESISLIESAFDEGYSLIGPRRCYGNNPSGVTGLSDFPDTISTYFMGLNTESLPQYDFDSLCKYCEGVWHPLNWPLLDFFDGVSHGIMNNGGKILHIDWNMVGSQNTEGKKNNDYISNLHFDCGSHLIHFGGVGSGYAYIRGKSNPESSYAIWAVGRWSLFGKFFYDDNEAIKNLPDAVYGPDGRWINGDYDENILSQLKIDIAVKEDVKEEFKIYDDEDESQDASTTHSLSKDSTDSSRKEDAGLSSEDKYDMSIHFTIKGQTIEDIKKKLNDWWKKQNIIHLTSEAPLVLHHCFLPRKVVVEKNFDTSVVDLLDSISEKNQICWYGTSEDLSQSRFLMLQNLQRLGGVAIFIGKIKDGVLDEYNLVSEMGIECVLIP